MAFERQDRQNSTPNSEYHQSFHSKTLNSLNKIIKF